MDEYGNLGARYRAEAFRLGWLYHYFNRMPQPGKVLFNFLFNNGGDMDTVSDPFQLAQLILLGVNYADKEGSGDHLILLDSTASLESLDNPFDSPARPYGYIQWGAFRPRGQYVRFSDWLTQELVNRAKTQDEVRIKDRFLRFLEERIARRA